MHAEMSLSLEDLLGKPYMEAVASAAVLLHGLDRARADALATSELAFFSAQIQFRLDALLDRIGQKVVDPMTGSLKGAPTDSFAKVANFAASPITGLGCLRLGEDGRLYLAAKSEHYHIPLGHNFPGYKLIDHARELGIVNATHNNTRGYITRLCEQELVRLANGLAKTQTTELADVLAERTPQVLNRVINLETGSLACEAGIKMMLARFYRLEKQFPAPVNAGKTPVFFVLGDLDGGRTANYHGTTVIAQTFRDMWPEIGAKMEAAGILKVVPVKINDAEDFAYKLATYQQGEYRVAGFLHEIILMNYGGIQLNPEFLQRAYQLCQAQGVPVLCDEIQSCMWYEGMFLFRKYGLKPDFVVVGKGFPGGQYPASRILLTAEFDNLNQFGALVTNGQEELASLAYLITMAYVEVNGSAISTLGRYYAEKINQLVQQFPKTLAYGEGMELLSALTFHEVATTVAFVKKLNAKGIDISAQVYKAFCPPAALVKLPIIATTKLVDWLISKMTEALTEVESQHS